MRLIYDLNIQPFSVGDMLTHQQAAILMNLQDTLILHDSHYRMVPQLGGIDPLKAMPWLMDSARANSECRTVEVVVREFYRPVPGDWPQSVKYTTYECWKIITDYFNEHGYLPSLHPRLNALAWAESYMAEHGKVTLQPRRNPFNPKRDADYGEWSAFIGNHRKEKFILISSENERDRMLECFGNATWADCDMERKLALVWLADFHLGMAAGPAQMRWYGEKPFSVFKEIVDPARVHGMTVENGVKKMPWMNEGQRLLPYADTQQEIENEYALYRDRCLRSVGERDSRDAFGAGRHLGGHEGADQLLGVRTSLQGSA